MLHGDRNENTDVAPDQSIGHSSQFCVLGELLVLLNDGGGLPER